MDRVRDRERGREDRERRERERRERKGKRAGREKRGERRRGQKRVGRGEKREGGGTEEMGERGKRTEAARLRIREVQQSWRPVRGAASLSKGREVSG